MSDPNDPAAWIEKAEEDYVVAVSSMRRKKPSIYVTCFHAQQCAEKYLKGMLVAKDKPFPKTHDLLVLSELCGKAGILLGMDNKALNDLSDYGVRVRYPGTEPTVEEAQDAMQTMKTVRKFARKFLSAE